MSKKSRSDIIYTVSGNTKYNQEDYTVAARHNISVVYLAADLADMDYQNIHDYLEKVCTQRVGFCGYLKRDLYRLMKREGILTDEKFEDVKVRKMNEYLRRSFRAGGVPFSFEGKEVKTDRWLTQKSVSRDVVLLVGFGLHMGPEQVDDYIRVTTPGMWLLVAAILILLGAGIIWGFATKLEMKKVDQKGQVTTEYVTPASFVTDGIAGN